MNEDTLRNVEVWTRSNVEYGGDRARSAWSREEIDWGTWHAPESDVRVLPPPEGLDVVELGCGTAYISAWFARRGARPVGVDPTPAQLATAREMQREFGLEFPLVEAGAENVPLPDSSFDLAVSEYGASIWADPYLWIPEAARLLRRDGLLVFLRNSTLVMLCSPDEGPAVTELVRTYDEIRRIEWPEPEGGVEFHLSHGDWIDLLRANGFEIERLVELRVPPGAETREHEYYYVSVDWARKWPAEEIWVARKRSG